jgi:cytochrome P450
MAPNEYSFTDPEVAKEIYAINSKYLKSSFYDAFGDPNNAHRNMFSLRDPKAHQEDRRKVASMYSLTSILSYEPYVDSSIALLSAKFRDFADQGQAFELMAWMQYYAFDVIGEITFGRSFGMMESGQDVDRILETIRVTAVIPAHLGLISELAAPFYYIVARLAPESPFASVEKLGRSAIHARTSGVGPTDRDDFLAKSLKLVEAGKMNEKLVELTMLSNVIAGSDTTGITLAAIMYHLIRNPTSMRKLQKELDDATDQGSLSESATFSEAIKLPYLQAVIKEGLRIHPAVGMLMGRVVPEGGRELAGHFFPAGVRSPSQRDEWAHANSLHSRPLSASMLGQYTATPISLVQMLICSARSDGWAPEKRFLSWSNTATQ